MTREEEIKQAVLEYAEKIDYNLWLNPKALVGKIKMLVIIVFKDGAKWADEHPKNNQEQLMQEINDLQFSYDGKCAEVERLRNPWRKVEDELPKKDCKVYVACYNGVEYDTAIFKVKSRKFYTQAEEKQTKIGEKDDVGSYMIGGDCRQITEYYSKGVREDITAQVTHWMPIPQVNNE